MNLPKISTLIVTASGLGMGIGVMAIFLNKETSKQANRSNFVTKAIDIMKSEPEVERLLGQSIDIGKANFRDGWSKLEEKHVKLRIPLKGENDKAFLYAYARKNDGDKKFRLYKLEATFNKIANKKLILFDRTNEPEEDKLIKDGPNDLSHLNAEERKKFAKQVMKTWK